MVARKAKAKAELHDITEGDVVRGLLGKTKIYYPVLGSCSLERKPIPESEGEPAEKKDKDSGRFYDSAIRPLVLDEDKSFAVCEFSAGRKVKETKVIEVQATYYVGFNIEDEEISSGDRKAFVEALVASSAWPLFRDLFIHIGSQSGDELPLLPNVPKLRWIAEDNKMPKRSKA